MPEKPPLLLQSLTIGGLKGFRDPQTIDFAPITLLFGPNSAGKSSILQSLLLLKQTSEAPASVDSPLITDGPWTDAGPYGELIHNHDVTNPLTIGIQAILEGAVHAVNPWNNDLPGKVPDTVPWTYHHAGWQWRWDWDPDAKRPILADQLVTVEDAPLMRLVPTETGDPESAADRPTVTTEGPLMIPWLAGVDHPLWHHWIAATKAYREAWVQAIDTLMDDVHANADEVVEADLERDRDPRWASTVVPSSEGQRGEYSAFAPPAGGPEDADGLPATEATQEAQDVRHQVLREIQATLDYWRAYCAGDDWRHARHDTLTRGGGAQDELGSIHPESFWVDRARHPQSTSKEHPAGEVPDPSGFGNSVLAPVVFRFHGAFVDEVSMPDEPRAAIRSEAGSREWLFGSEVNGRPLAPVPSLGEVGRDVSRGLAAFLRTRLTYVAPYRQPLPAIDLSGTARAESVGIGGAALLALLAHQPVRVGYLNAALQKLGVPYRAVTDSATLGLPEAVWFARLVDTRTEVSVRPSGVGHGITQVLPLLVESTREDPTVILVEQPELHLHPRLQAELGSTIADAAMTRGHQYVIETHSEHLVLRLQRLVRRKQLDPAALAIYYVDQEHVIDDGGREDWVSRVRRLRLDADGDFIDEWPDGFFEEAYREMFGEDEAR